MPSSLQEIDLKKLLGDYHRHQCHTENSSSIEDDVIPMGSPPSMVPSASEPVFGWDETIADDEGSSSSDAIDTDVIQQRLHVRSDGSLTPNAMAHRSWIYGIAEEGLNCTDSKDKPPARQSESKWELRWKTSLAPHRIQQLTSNSSGTIIAATTDNGTVSIIRARDGTILATRKVVEANPDDDCTLTTSSSSLLGISTEVSFVTSNIAEQSVISNPRDALLVKIPDQPLLLVSNIQGDRLNDYNDSVVTQATKSMHLQSVQIPSIEPSDVQCMCGYFYSSKNDHNNENQDDTEDFCQKIRLILIHRDLSGEARLALAEYDLGGQVCRLLRKNISVLKGSEWKIDTFIGLRLTSIINHFILGMVVHPTSYQTNKFQKMPKKELSAKSKILWLDPDHDLVVQQKDPLSKDCRDRDVVNIKEEYSFSTPLKDNCINKEYCGRYQHSHVRALEFIHSFNSQEILAMAVAIGGAGGENSSEVQIMQAQVKNDVNSRMLQMGRAHLLYRIGMPQAFAMARSISFCQLDPEIYGPYSFRSKSSLGWNHFGQIHTFQTRRSGDKINFCSSIGEIRLLITKNEFDKARALVHEVGMEVLLDDESARFHPAEIVLQRLRRSLSRLLESDNGVASSHRQTLDDDWSESLVGLRRGAGNLKGQRVVLEAADYVLNWPPKKDISNLHYEVIVMRLTSFLETMRSSSEDFLDRDAPSWISAKYNNVIHALQEKLTALSYLDSLLKDPNSGFEISPQYSSVVSIGDLFFCFVQNSNFTAAEKLWGSAMRSKLSASVLVSSFQQIPSTIHPMKYSNLLENVVLPSLSINHELLSLILSWSCKLADDFDNSDENGLEESIFLLKTIVRGTKRLRLKIHSSFAYYSPFVDQSGDAITKGGFSSNRKRKDSNASTSGILSLDSTFGNPNDDSLPSDRRKKKPRNSSDDHQPNPTVLELGRMKRGATRSGQVQSLSVDMIDEIQENVETKLETALWLKLARSLGLRRDLLFLHNFIDQGGTRYASKELIRFYSSFANSHEERYDALTKRVSRFCSVSRAGYDEALIDYSKELCGSRNTSTRDIEEVASIARCCFCPTSKCQITKIALQAALFCRFAPVWLTKLSKDAIEWSAGDSSLRSELEEASRLLLIDGIIGRYCGNGAKELFHIDNPLHATRLLDFVSKHLNHSTVLSDILDLCEAFHHLSVEDGCGRLMQNVILRGHQDMAINILQSLYHRNLISAHNVFSRVISFCIDLIEDNASHLGVRPDVDGDIELSIRLKESKIITKCSYELTKIAIIQSRVILRDRFGSGFTTWQYNESRLHYLLLDLERLIELQQDHSIFVSLADLNDPKVMVGIASKLFGSLADVYVNGKANAASMIATQTKKACSLLSRTPQLKEADLLFTSVTPVACQLALRTDGFEAFDFLTDLRILEASKCNFATRCCVAVSLTYCMKLSKSKSDLSNTMKGLVMASSLLQDYILLNCTRRILGVAIEFSQLCDVVSQVLARADEGFGEELNEFRKTLHERASAKRWSFALSNSLSRNTFGESVRVGQPVLHPSWYVGDGLLLPPEEALKRGIDFCKQTMGIQILEEPSMGIHAFVANRGAHALTLRILSHSTMIRLCRHKSDFFSNELEGFNQQISIALVERYLGGTGNGITSGVVDSQLALSFLLSLPLKLAFKIYKSSLPTAINTRDFRRVVTLAIIGKVAGTKDSIMSPTGARLGNWTRQEKFVSQCDLLATKANWWNVLEENNVSFNPHNFEDETLLDRPEDSYISSMIPALISNMMSKKDGRIDCTLALAIKFANAFSIPKDQPACNFIQYLLTPTKSDGGQCIRKKVTCLNETVRELLRKLESSSKRINILRRCLIQFESHDNCIDYERLSVVYSLYQAELSLVLSKYTTEENGSMDNLFVELELIDRRRDALAILSSYFQGDKRNERPSFSRFFAPLNESIYDNTNTKEKSKRFSSRILGWEAPLDTDMSDPLDPLEKILRSSCSSAVTSALSPICIPLCVPRGYIKVRSLITRFQKSCYEGASLPTFEGDVLPILNQLRASSDVAELAEWCSKQYELSSPDKLTCLDHALNFAIKASTELESRTGQREERLDMERKNDELASLSRVKRITLAKDLLEDRLEITKILQPQNMKFKSQGSVSNLLEKLLEKLEGEVWNKPDSFVPEHFVDTLFGEASLLVAEATLCDDHSLSVGQFRQISHLIHEVCNCIARKYSHVQSSYQAHRLTKRWLLYGDQQISETDREKDKTIIPHVSQNDKLFPDIDEEDTMNFEMDLSILKEGPSSFGMVSCSSTAEKKNLTSSEEPSSLKATSGREISELASQRSALRIAFVMAFADGNSRPDIDNSSEENDENSRNHLNRKPNAAKTTRRGLLSKAKKTKAKQQLDQHISVLQHARDLIRIIFVRSTSTDRVIMGINSSFDSINAAATDHTNSASTTFAMRHRCLRVASILIPQEALEEVLKEDELDSNISLKECAFGSFCAKELEEMGLPIPHSDLVQLSQMHFPSYARALWRHHRDIKGAKGRFFLLILELYLKETISDNNFFLSIINEIESLNLPRTLLLSFECIIRYMDVIGPENTKPFLEMNNIEISRIIGKLLQLVFADLNRNIETLESDGSGDDNLKEHRCTMKTLNRLSRVVGAFSTTSEGQRMLLDLCNELLRRFPVLANNRNDCQSLRIMLEHAIFRIEAMDTQGDLFDRLSTLLRSGSTKMEKESKNSNSFSSDTPLFNPI